MVTALLVVTAGMIVLSTFRAQSVHIGTDFFMYYTSGEHFTAGEYLYKNPASGAPYVYPPFAAFLFQGMNLVGQGTATAIVFVLNFFLTLCNAALIYAIARKFGFEKRRAGLAMGLGLLFTATEVWNNINFSQINVFIFFLTLLGIYSYLCGKTNRALLLLSIGAWIKVLPVFFVFWILIRSFSWKRLMVVALVSLGCVGLPFLQHGPEQGTTDLLGYYNDFLRENMVDEVNTIWRNQSLSAAVTRALVPEENAEGLDYAWVNAGPEVAKVVSKVFTLGVFFLAFALVGWRTWKGHPVTIFEVCMMYLASHLFSGVTWRGHLLTTFFILVPLFLLRIRQVNWPRKVVHYGMVLWFFVLVAGVKGLWPGNGFKFLHGWSFIAWGLLLLFIYYASYLFQSNPHAPAGQQES